MNKRERIIEILKDKGRATINTLAVAVGGTSGDVQVEINRLVDKGMVELMGKAYELTAMGKDTLEELKPVDNEETQLASVLAHYLRGEWKGRAALAAELGMCPLYLRKLQHMLIRKRYIRVDRKIGRYVLIQKRKVA